MTDIRDKLTPSTWVPIGLAAVAIAGASSGAWAVSAKLASIENHQAALAAQLDSALADRAEFVTRLELENWRLQLALDNPSLTVPHGPPRK